MHQFREEMLTWLDHKAPAVVLVFDAKFRLVQANAFALRLLGGDALGKNLSEIFVDFHEEMDLEELASTGSGERILHLGAGYLPQSLFFSFFQHGDSFLAMGRPEVETAQALERALQEISAELSNLNRELNKKNAQLALLNEEKNHFLGIAAHDLRSPLGHVLTCSGLLLEDENPRLTQEEREFLSIIRDSSSFMLGLIDDILDISAIEAGQLNLYLAPVDLASLVQDNVQLNRLLAEKRDVSLVLEKMEDIPPLEADSGKLRQVMNNLLSNAIKFSPASGRIIVSLMASERHAVVSVADEGPGIPEQDLGKLFQPFTKISVKSRSGEKSSGLGLSIAHRIITGHGGRMWVDSWLGQGTTFYFAIPLRQKVDQP